MAAAAAVGAASAASMAWELIFQPHPKLSRLIIRSWAAQSVKELPEMFRQIVGVFGPLTVRMSRITYVTWAMMAASLVVAALVVGNPRERRALLLASLSVPVASLGVSVAIVHQTGFGMQGRYVSAMAVGVPLLAGEVVLRNRTRVRAGAAAVLTAICTLPAALVQLVAWYTNARRYAVGTAGPMLFIGSARWVPRGGWAVWCTAAVAGAALMVGFSARATFAEWRQPPALQEAVQGAGELGRGGR